MNKNNEEIEIIPKKLPSIIVRDIVPIPFNDLRLEIGREFSINALKLAEVSQNPYVVILLQKNIFQDLPKISDIEKYGVLAKILASVKIDNEFYKVKLRIIKRIKNEKILKTEDNIFITEYKDFPTKFGDLNKEKSLIKLIMERISININQLLLISENTFLEQIKNGITTEKAVDLIVFALKIEEKNKYKYLKESNLNKRLMYILQDIEIKLSFLELEDKINAEVKRSIDENQKEFYLREKMRAIQNELGDKVKKEEEIEELRKKINLSKMPKKIKVKVLQELSRYQSISSALADSFVIRNYLDFVVSLPWGKSSKDIDDLSLIQCVLEKNHYGLKKAKERIVEYAAVKIMTKKNPQTIICLVGPPGVGKTTLAISIAEALGRKFIKQSLGGLQEESEIKGHRRTFVGAMPGRILSGLRDAGVINPVFLLDEIDKLVNNFQHDPGSSLLEVLDPNQNKNFVDLYLSEPFDLSQVLFITTANDLSNVPEPLKDRLEIIELNSYTEQDKMIIAEKYLLPRQLREHGISENEFKIDKSSFLYLIRHYTKEAGVRNLNKILATLVRKTIKEILMNKTERIHINNSNIEIFLGKIIYQHLLANNKNQIGVVNGLAYTSFGGDILPIEVAHYKGSGKLLLTGNLGKVLEESAITSFSFLKSNAEKLGIEYSIFDNNDFHVHFIEGTIPKDGPSAGVTIATCIFSAITKQFVRKDVGMTGEITLTGTINLIGGLKEKAIAAERSGLSTIFIPKDNLKDLDEIPEEVRQKIEIIAVENAKDVFAKALIS
ncbi:MAG: endopeptidase La [Candidatus Phytoplasma stylosanthis]|uniref:endopeptidase La n=1 Tax=Candidatus Phytoplasma stylosanthis TaxID=2798314 RepID=UPI00293A3B77|nr:endopeptidase La [Candidatus Phytoplasma stylosanthis]MDV3167960.1 endopeptidase La [Candidatus Phytoplasma stylosanthis]MDV3171052.1 endopeptidase La [Candidatus Phytoplasma stylosanthis]MDV3173659.1 endopeptidase La [Candidatus Phytoplasma stylosanthis]MDV3174226.1 endopeptidase La [Candidatus Phytoplasma stylosanthis]MDV3202717.1 endopeptidase La [Candidatus Phytoplasma stylosanthis]